MTERVDLDAQELWQSQGDGDAVISVDDIRSRARRLEQAVSIRNLLEYVAAAVVVAAFGIRMWWESSAVVRVSGVMVIAATLFVTYQLRRRGTATQLPAELGVKHAVDFHRGQLERQRDLVQDVWRWYLLPFMPGLVGLQIGLAVSGQAPVANVTVQIAVICVGFVAVHGLNRRAARRLQHRIDRLIDHT
jgi:membrane protein YdbS with pleckstrin-like domain